MKDEEMAKEYTKNLLKKLGIKEDMLLENQPKYLRQESMNFVALDVENVTDGFLAGLKAGRPQWHKVADDLPKDEGIYLVAWKRTVFDKKYGGKYGFQVDYFKNRRFEIVGEYAIAWCEIPTFDKE